MRAVLLVLAPLLLGMLPGPTGPEEQLDIEHWDSIQDGWRFQEVFVVRSVPAAATWETEDMVFTLDGTPITVVWEQEGRVMPGQTFSFPLESSDRSRTLAAHAEGSTLWRLEFGPGSGTPVRGA